MNRLNQYADRMPRATSTTSLVADLGTDGAAMGWDRARNRFLGHDWPPEGWYFVKGAHLFRWESSP